jgi:hypothetical protein
MGLLGPTAGRRVQVWNRILMVMDCPLLSVQDHSLRSSFQDSSGEEKEKGLSGCAYDL